jgi:hypothetical protein
MATALALVLALGGAAGAQIGGPYDLTWSTIDGGGGTFSTGGAYRLGGTVGQYDPGTLVGGPYVVLGGFWRGGATSAATGVEPPDSGPAPDGTPLAFRLYPNSPNPFNPVTSIRYDLPRATDVQMRVYDVTGALVRELARGPAAAGRHVQVWDGTKGHGESVASGIYFLRLETAEEGASQKMILAK